jgi:hypothetical protein
VVGAHGDLGFSAGDVIEIVQRTDNTNEWWSGRIAGREGALCFETTCAPEQGAKKGWKVNNIPVLIQLHIVGFSFFLVLLIHFTQLIAIRSNAFGELAVILAQASYKYLQAKRSMFRNHMCARARSKKRLES